MTDDTMVLKRRWVWLPWLRGSQWGELRQLSAATLDIVNQSIVESMRTLPTDPNHPHGGQGGIQLTELTQYVIKHCIIDLLTPICTELRLRPVKSIPWLLRSKELVVYASRHSKTPAALKYLLAVAPQSLHVICRTRGFTLLHEAAFCMKPNNVRVLLSAKCDASIRSHIGETALHIACHGQSDQSRAIIHELVSHNAGLSEITDDSGLLPIDRLKYTQKKRLIVAKHSPSLDEQHAEERVARLLVCSIFNDDDADASARRVADDCMPYTRQEFLEFYGNDVGLRRWESAQIEDGPGTYITTRNVEIINRGGQVCTTLPGGIEVEIVEIFQQTAGADIFGEVPSFGGWIQITCDCVRFARKKGCTQARCRSCGITAGKRRTPKGILFCAVCGAS